MKRVVILREGGKERPTVKPWDWVLSAASSKTAEPIEMLFGMWTRVGPRKHVLDVGAHWRHPMNTIELNSCAAAMQPFCEITLTTCCSHNTLLSVLEYKEHC